jgi:hypothetical protein
MQELNITDQTKGANALNIEVQSNNQGFNVGAEKLLMRRPPGILIRNLSGLALISCPVIAFMVLRPNEKRPPKGPLFVCQFDDNTSQPVFFGLLRQDPASHCQITRPRPVPVSPQ